MNGLLVVMLVAVAEFSNSGSSLTLGPFETETACVRAIPDVVRFYNPPERVWGVRVRAECKSFPVR